MDKPKDYEEVEHNGTVYGVFSLGRLRKIMEHAEARAKATYQNETDKYEQSTVVLEFLRLTKVSSTDYGKDIVDYQVGLMTYPGEFDE